MSEGTREELFEFKVKVFLDKLHMDRKFLARAEFPDGRVAYVSSQYVDFEFGGDYDEQARRLIRNMLYYLIEKIMEDRYEQHEETS